MKVGVVIPVLNQYQMALDAIASIQTVFDYEVYVQPNYVVNRGVSGAWNDGIEKAFSRNCEYVLVINDDVVLSPWTIDNQIRVLEENAEEDFVLTTGWQTTPPDPNNPRSMMWYGEPPMQAAWIPGADFACFMIGKRCWMTVGKFDEEFNPAYFEDNDYHRRILLSGLQARIVPQAPYYHYGSSSGGVQTDLFENNKGYYVRKWGGIPGAECFATPFNIPEADLSTTINNL